MVVRDGCVETSSTTETVRCRFFDLGQRRLDLLRDLIYNAKHRSQLPVTTQWQQQAHEPDRIARLGSPRLKERERGTNMQTITIPAEIQAAAKREFGAPEVLEFFAQQCAAAGTLPGTPAAWPAQIADLAARLGQAGRHAKSTVDTQTRFTAAIERP
jgi:hypothetical protein